MGRYPASESKKKPAQKGEGSQGGKDSAGRNEEWKYISLNDGANKGLELTHKPKTIGGPEVESPETQEEKGTLCGEYQGAKLAGGRGRQNSGIFKKGGYSEIDGVGIGRGKVGRDSTAVRITSPWKLDQRYKGNRKPDMGPLWGACCEPVRGGPGDLNAGKGVTPGPAKNGTRAQRRLSSRLQQKRKTSLSPWRAWL